ncbi:hypothetical protein AB0I53_47190 [Saccharopolyspora sp. NPDC050389]|uniref:hypothetical protein n=1 Tax=Saccharopolyspora sp. NPDC050389 TaxID=3155516 RepID=UPI0033E9FF3C
MRRWSAAWVRGYGASPLHLLVLLVCFAITGYVAFQLWREPLLIRMLVWFAAAIIVHDLVLFPLYALADRSLTAAVRTRRAAAERPRVSPLNYIRVPAMGAGLLFLLFLPGIIQQGAPTYLAATGQTQAPFLVRWLVLVLCLFAASALAYAVRVGRDHLRLRRERRPAAASEPEEDD